MRLSALSLRILAPICAGALINACDSSQIINANLRVYDSPYADVDWDNDLRLKAQHHDHVGVDPAKIIAYDEAGYDVVSLMDYSGNLNLPYAWRERHWPPEQWVPTWVLANLVNIKFFLPNAEEVGIDRYHATSPFLERHITGVLPIDQSSNERFLKPGEYSTFDEAFALIRGGGGVPCIAHPWTFSYEEFPGMYCVEIYTAFGEARRHQGSKFLQSLEPRRLLNNWDYTLEKNQQAWGIAVNDHFGPGLRSGIVPDEIRDSGKIIVLAKSADRRAYKTAFERGAILAIADRGSVKDQYPHIGRIEVFERSVSIETNGSVEWITRRKVVGNGPNLFYSQLPQDSRYIRAEITGGDGSVVYTQAFVVRPVGDVDGDYDVDEDDRYVCERGRNGASDELVITAACLAAVTVP